MSDPLAGWRLFTSFGDQAVLLPVAAMTAVLLVASGERRAALWWCLAVGIALGSILFAKLLCIPCANHLTALHIRSPSGHVAATAAVYGGLVALLWRYRPLPITSLAVALVCCLVVAMAASRVVLGAHTVPETIVGAVLGLTAPAILSGKPALFPRPAGRSAYWLAAVPLAGLAFLGAEAGLEPGIHLVAGRLALTLGVCS